MGLDIKVDPATNDLALDDSGDLIWIEGAEAIAQHVRIRLRFVRGEWFLNQDEGFPFFETVLVHHPSTPAITEAYRRAIAETPGIASVEKCVVTIDRQARTVTVDAEATTTDGTTLTGDDFGPFVLPL